MGIASVAAVVGFWVDRDLIYIGGVAMIFVGAVALYVLDSTAPNPKDAPAPHFAELEDRKRWSEDPITEPWDEHVLCTDCQGRKLCPSCGGESGGCVSCAKLCWCASCGGAGQWPRDLRVPIYAPAPASKRLVG